jgi:ribosomal protein S18 acetylase RimI-like enzyme
VAVPRELIRAFDPALDLAWATALLDAQLGGRIQARAGELIDALCDGGLVAEVDGDPVGLVTWRVQSDPAPATSMSAEITALAVAAPARGGGVGRAMLEGALRWLRERAARRVWLVTTNDNLAALGLYQSVGFRLVARRPGAVDEARRTIKPSIAEVSENGIPIRDELELAKQL